MPAQFKEKPQLDYSELLKKSADAEKQKTPEQEDVLSKSKEVKETLEQTMERIARELADNESARSLAKKRMQKAIAEMSGSEQLPKLQESQKQTQEKLAVVQKAMQDLAKEAEAKVVDVETTHLAEQAQEAVNPVFDRIKLLKQKELTGTSRTETLIHEEREEYLNNVEQNLQELTSGKAGPGEMIQGLAEQSYHIVTQEDKKEIQADLEIFEETREQAGQAMGQANREIDKILGLGKNQREQRLEEIPDLEKTALAHEKIVKNADANIDYQQSLLQDRAKIEELNRTGALIPEEVEELKSVFEQATQELDEMISAETKEQAEKDAVEIQAELNRIAMSAKGDLRVKLLKQYKQLIDKGIDKILSRLEPKESRALKNRVMEWLKTAGRAVAKGAKPVFILGGTGLAVSLIIGCGDGEEIVEAMGGEAGEEIDDIPEPEISAEKQMPEEPGHWETHYKYNSEGKSYTEKVFVTDKEQAVKHLASLEKDLAETDMTPEFLDDSNWNQLTFEQKIDLFRQQSEPCIHTVLYLPGRPSVCKDLKKQNYNDIENSFINKTIGWIRDAQNNDVTYDQLCQIAKPEDSEENINLHRDYRLLVKKLFDTYKQIGGSLLKGETEISTEWEKEQKIQEMEQLNKNFEHSKKRLILRDSALKNIVERDKILKELDAKQKEYGIGGKVNNFLYSMEQNPVLMREMPKLVEQETERINAKLAKLGIDVKVNSFELFGNIMGEGLAQVFAKNDLKVLDNISGYGALGIDSYVSRLAEEALNKETAKKLLNKYNLDIKNNNPKGTVLELIRTQDDREVRLLLKELIVRLPKLIRNATKDKTLCNLTSDALIDLINFEGKSKIERFKNESGEYYLTYNSLKLQKEALPAAASLYAVYKIEVAKELAKQGVKMEELPEAEQFALTIMKFNSSTSRAKKTIKDFAENPKANSILNPEYIKVHKKKSPAYGNVVKRVFGTYNAMKTGFFHKKSDKTSMQKDLTEWEKNLG